MSILAKGGEFEEALEIAERVRELGEDDYDYYFGLTVLCETLARVGRPDDALALVSNIADEGKVMEALVEISEALSDTGQIQRALDVARRIRGEAERSEALRYVAIGLVRSGQVEVVIDQVFPQMQDSDRQQVADFITRTFILREQYGEAIQFVRKRYVEPKKTFHLAEIYLRLTGSKS